MKVSFFGLFWAMGQPINADLWKSKDVIWLRLMPGRTKMSYEMKMTTWDLQFGLCFCEIVSVKHMSGHHSIFFWYDSWLISEISCLIVEFF